MDGGGGDDVDGIAGVDEGIGIQESGQLVLIGDLIGGIVIGVIETDQFDIGDLFPVVQVKLAEVSDAEDANF